MYPNKTGNTRLEGVECDALVGKKNQARLEMENKKLGLLSSMNLLIIWRLRGKIKNSQLEMKKRKNFSYIHVQDGVLYLD